MKVWAFNRVDDLNVDSDRVLIYESVKNGKSRFGWSYKDEHNLLGETWSDCHSKQLFLLQIEVGDWIVHINTPSWGKCVAAQVSAKYAFDEGLKCRNGQIDFRHVIEVDKNSVIEFERRNKNILPAVNLNPRQRYHRIYAAKDFLESIENIKQDRVSLKDGESRELFHLKDETDKLLKEITQLLHKTHKRQNLEHFLAEVFKKIPGVTGVKKNGIGWGSDNGADLIITTSYFVGNIDFENVLVVQAKSFSGEQHDLTAVDQIKTAITKYGASAGMIITTAERTAALEAEVEKASKELNDCPIDLLAGDDVARFVLKYAPDLLFRL
jgi:restriction endonuclease Mrr